MNTTEIADTTALFHALSDPTRLRIVALLQAGERCVCELMEELDAGQSRLSFHLRTLRDAGIVNDRRDGRWVYYTLDRGTLRVVEDVVKAFRTSVPVRATSAGCCR